MTMSELVMDEIYWVEVLVTIKGDCIIQRVRGRVIDIVSEQVAILESIDNNQGVVAPKWKTIKSVYEVVKDYCKRVHKSVDDDTRYFYANVNEVKELCSSFEALIVELKEEIK